MAIAKWLSLLALLPSIPLAADTATPPALADYVAHCDAEGRKVWNESLCAPVVVVTQDGTVVWTSITPSSAPLPSTRANTSIEWGGRKWVMLLAPLPGDEAALRRLVYHESFHVQQAALGFPDNMAVAAHLESEQARVSMRLEWNALERALASMGAERKKHVAQALAFRQQRLGDATARNDERAQMRHEGLAEYTGTVLSGDAKGLALESLQRGNDRPSFARSFAYVSGPAWGLLLDDLAPEWKTTIAKTPDADLPDLIPLKTSRMPKPDAYDGDAIAREEAERATRRKQIIDDATQRTSEANGLHLPLAKIQLDFDPNRVTPMPDGSQVYDKITLTSDWGTIQVEGAPLRIVKDWNAAYVPWPLPDTMTLKLADGWSAQRDADGRMEVGKKATP
ncbi:hypothetical protein [Noviluteimonas gilva]|uniref:Uncharacterized protein n=1 Tax=Noviluteimonas gilva TaxID=2682097 RepID=A0A7C9LZG7_9GAMM|nr:hypothetical protein [Lysobacter gilvus]MUV12948.1 hypothetical protein [Lysobacter gilvus]